MKSIDAGDSGDRGTLSLLRFEVCAGQGSRIVRMFIGCLWMLVIQLPVYAGELTIDWYTIDCGGTTLSTNGLSGGLELSGSIGQSDAGPLQGPMVGADLELIGGFWGKNIRCAGSGAPVPEMILDTVSVLQVNTKNRFLSFTAGEAGASQAVRVTFDSLRAPFDSWNGAQLWVGPPREVSENGGTVAPTPGFPTFQAATLQCTPYYTDWSALGVVHVFHEGIVPEGTYRIQVINETCDATVETSFSPPLVMTTANWGDTLKDFSTVPPPPPEGVVTIFDVLGVLGRFTSKPTSITKARADLEPGCLDLVVNITDALYALDGFKGITYPFEPTAPDPCASTCRNPLP